MNEITFLKIAKEDIEEIKKSNNIKEIIEKDIIFPTEKDAKNYLQDMSKLYESVYTEFQEPLEDYLESEDAKDILSKLNIAIENFYTFPDKLIERFAKQKSSTKGCPNCKSTISKDFYIKKINSKIEEFNINHSLDNKEFDYVQGTKDKLKITICPICDSEDFIFNETDSEKHNKMKLAIDSIENKIQEEKMLFQVKSGQKIVGIIFYNS